MSFPTPADAKRWLELRDTDPRAFSQLPAGAQEIAQMVDDLQAAREHRPAQPWSQRNEQSDELLGLRDSKEAEDRARFAALPERTRDELQIYEDVAK